MVPRKTAAKVLQNPDTPVTVIPDFGKKAETAAETAGHVVKRKSINTNALTEHLINAIAQNGTTKQVIVNIFFGKIQ